MTPKKDAWQTLAEAELRGRPLDDLTWNTLEVWRAIKAEDPVPAPRQLERPGHCLIWRDGLITRYRSLCREEHAALAAVLAGASFAIVCEGLVSAGASAETVPLRAAGFLKGWLSQGLVSELKT